ncbi:hypothetical protein KIPB_005804 [Kipferlia bialata]|uniref:Uncharacterized protein n=1 Tax=Kipferlia bialata TaxID=797122 RepID=A0A9K3CW85_9EUKA|nr:hypothetical protein KIPB_005804 [Kipferlia bialata]|eukprot:g5804.t1
MGFEDRFQDKSPDKQKGERGRERERERERDVPVKGYALPDGIPATVCNGNVYPYPSQDQAPYSQIHRPAAPTLEPVTDQPIIPDGVLTPMSVADNQALLTAVTMASTLQEQNKELQETVSAMKAAIRDLERERDQAPEQREDRGGVMGAAETLSQRRVWEREREREREVHEFQVRLSSEICTVTYIW